MARKAQRQQLAEKRCLLLNEGQKDLDLSKPDVTLIGIGLVSPVVFRKFSAEDGATGVGGMKIFVKGRPDNEQNILIQIGLEYPHDS